MPLTLALAGDSVITRRAPTADGHSALELREIIRSADLGITNLEVLPNDFRGYPAPAPGDLCVAAERGVIDDLVELGFQALGWANNHSLDFGTAGVLAALEALDGRRMAHSGVGINLEAAAAPCYVDRPGGSVALLACTSSFETGQQATVATAGLAARPGVNPLRHRRVNQLPASQLDVLREAHRALGLDAEADYPITMGLPSPVKKPVLRLFGFDFAASATACVVTRCESADVTRICESVQDARDRADVVVVSVHAHEWGTSIHDPPAFLRELAHGVVDSGADVVMGHGPHILRGIEIHHGRPIFSILGNFIFEYEFVQRMPLDTYDVLGVPPTVPPRLALGGLRFRDHPEYWQSVLPLIQFEQGAVEDITLFPISLGFGQATKRRGRPPLAAGEEASAIFGRLAALSAELGATVELASGRFGRHGAIALRLAATDAACHGNRPGAIRPI